MAKTTKAKTTKAKTTKAKTTKAKTTKVKTTKANTTKVKTTKANTTKVKTTKANTTKVKTTKAKTTKAGKVARTARAAGKVAKAARMRFTPMSIDKAILNVVNKSPAGYAKIRSIVTRANSRIYRLQNKAAFSPALKQVMAGTRNGKFELNKNMDWEQMKRTYSQAMEFLNSPTSTVHNANVYLKALGRKLDLSEAHTKILLDKINSIYITDKGYIGAGDSLTIREQLLQMHEGMPVENMPTEQARFKYYEQMLDDILHETSNEVRELAQQQMLEKLEDIRKAFYGF